MVRVPKFDRSQKSTIDYTKLGKEESQLQIVKTFKHESDVSKARAMRQDWHTIASLLSNGEIALYQSNENWGESAQ
jgi:hypothetical protein